MVAGAVLNGPRTASIFFYSMEVANFFKHVWARNAARVLSRRRRSNRVSPSRLWNTHLFLPYGQRCDGVPRQGHGADNLVVGSRNSLARVGFPKFTRWSESHWKGNLNSISARRSLTRDLHRSAYSVEPFLPPMIFFMDYSPRMPSSAWSMRAWTRSTMRLSKALRASATLWACAWR